MARVCTVALLAVVLTLSACKRERTSRHVRARAGTARPARQAVVGSARCVAVDRSKLHAVVGCYFAPDATAAEKWAMLSTTSHAQSTFASYRAVLRASVCKTTRAAVLGRSASHARVTRDLRCTRKHERNPRRRTCTRVTTATFVHEPGGWAMLWLPKQRGEMLRAWRASDYRGVLAAADRLLALDPFAVDAFNYKLMTLKRKYPRRWRAERAALLRRAMATNPRSTSALFVSVTHTTDRTVVGALIDQMARRDCTRAVAVFNVALRTHRPRERLAFLSRQRDLDGGALVLEIDAMRRAGQKAAIADKLTREALADMHAFLRGEDASNGARWGAVAGDAAIAAGRPEVARRFANAAIARDPTNTQARALLRKLPPAH